MTPTAHCSVCGTGLPRKRRRYCCTECAHQAHLQQMQQRYRTLRADPERAERHRDYWREYKRSRRKAD